MSKFISPVLLEEEVGKIKTPNSFRGSFEVEWLNSAVKHTAKIGNKTAELDTQIRAYQREKVSPDSWKQEIMRTILSDSYARIPEIHIRITRYNGIWRLEVVDGQQRVIAIIDFLDGKYSFPEDFIIKDGEQYVNLGGMNIDDIKENHPEYYNRILRYNLGCAWYENLTDEMTSDLFTEILNNVNTMRPQEIRNAVLGFLSEYVRNTARPIGQMEVKPLFARTTKNAGTSKAKEVMDLFKISLGGRMEMDEWLTELIYLKKNTLRGGIKSSQEVTNWWKNIQRNGEYKHKFTDEKLINDLLIFAHKIIVAANVNYENKMNSMHTLVLVLYADELKCKYGSINHQQYVKKFFEVYNKWNDDKFVLDTNKRQWNGSLLPIFSKLFNGKNYNAVNSICMILDFEFKQDPESFGIIQLDTRDFSEDDRYKKWIEQGKKDYYTNLPLAFEDAAGDHYIPRSKGKKAGGVTEYENLVITSRANNLRKGNMHGDEFKQLLSEEMKLAA